jgi:hypothetical protein
VNNIVPKGADYFQNCLLVLQEWKKIINPEIRFRNIFADIKRSFWAGKNQQKTVHDMYILRNKFLHLT